MPSRFSRWTLLLIFAACNLAFWLGAAVATGLLVSREVDLGVETLLRERQATAVVVWEEAMSRVPKRLALQTSTPSATVAAQATKPEALGQIKTVVAETPSSAATKAANPDATQAPSMPESRTASTESPELVMTEAAHATQYPTAASPPSAPTPLLTPQVQRAAVTPTAAPSEAAAATRPQATLVSSPLLLSNCDFDDLAYLDEEMNRSAVGRAVQIRYREATLNEEIKSFLGTRPDLPYRDVEVDLQRGQVLLTGDVVILGFDVSTEVLGKVVVEDCLPRLETQSVSIAGVLTPGFVKEQVREIADDALSWYRADYPLCLDQIVIEDERATLYGHRR